jgi:carbamoyltransferase
MIILGINGNILNRVALVNESSACIIKDGEIIAAVAQERVSREKVDGRFPIEAIKEVLSIAKISIEDVNYVASSSLHPYFNSKKYLKSILTTFFDSRVLLYSKLKSFSYYTIYNKLKTKSKIETDILGKKFDICFNDHHKCHAASAFYSSNFENSLIVTLDGGGDGLDGSVYFGIESKMIKIMEIPHFQSIGTMYSAVTKDLGFKRHRHEGKITGLAAYGNPDPVRLNLENLILYNKKKHRFISKKVAKLHLNINNKSNIFHPLLKKHTKEDIAAVAQEIFEREVLKFIKDAILEAKKKGFTSKNICLAGGCFANVKVNQKIFRDNNFNDIFIFPAMGDDGVSVGAGYLTYFKKSKDKIKLKSKISDAYLGREYSDDEIIKTLEKHNLNFHKSKNIAHEVAKLLSEGKVVARFNGRMEYGPRSLGNRSIIASPFDKKINDWLNKKLNRNEFMPFAPSIIEEKANEYLLDYNKESASKYMTMTYDILGDMGKKIPAVVHIDNTARPQVVNQVSNSSFHNIIYEFYKITGVPVLLNTSFNMHEEPIVMSPNDAVRNFINGNLDVLAISDYIVISN